MTTSIDVDTYVFDTLLRDLVGHDRHPSAFLVYLHLWRQCDGGRCSSGPWSLRKVAAATGLSKRSVQDAVKALERRKLIRVERPSAYREPEYEVLRPWRKRGGR